MCEGNIWLCFQWRVCIFVNPCLCEVWEISGCRTLWGVGKCLFLHWQWRGNLFVAPHEGWGISDCLQCRSCLCVAPFDE